MARVPTTSEQVKLVINTTLEDVSFFITTAQLIVDEQLVGKGMSDKRLSQIEIYLAAHFVSAFEREPQMEKIGDSEVRYDGFMVQEKMDLQQTRFGKNAIMLDTSKTLLYLGAGAERFDVL